MEPVYRFTIALSRTSKVNFWPLISGVAVSPELTRSEGILSGVYVTGVFGESPAERVGLLAFSTLGGNGTGDVITAVD